jgi:zinc protease
MGARAVFAAGLCFAISAVPLEAHAQSRYASLLPNTTTATLENGLRVVVAPNPRTARIAVGLIYGVGTVDEPRRGSWALLHQLAYRHVGTPRMSVAEIERAHGEDDLRLNWEDRRFEQTAVYAQAPSTHLARAIWELSESMASLFDGMDRARYEAARSKVVADLRQKGDNTNAFLEIESRIWPQGHLYHSAVTPPDEQIAALAIEDARKIHRACWVPNNATVVITGNFDPSHAQDLVRKYFGPIPSSGADNACRKPRTFDATPVRAATVAFETGASEALVEIAWPTPGVTDPDRPALDVAASILSTRLYAKLVQQLKVARSAWAGHWTEPSGSLFYVRAVAPAGQRSADAKRAVEEELERILRDGVATDEVESARRAGLAGAVNFEDPLAAAKRLGELRGEPDINGRLRRDVEAEERLDAQTVSAALRKHLAAARKVAVAVDHASGAPSIGRILGGKR